MMALPSPTHLLDFHDRVVLVTGASQGVGAGIARRFGEAGAVVAVHYRSNEAGAEAIVAAIRQEGSRAGAVRADLTQRAEVEQLFDTLIERFGKLDVLINNAAGQALAPLLEMTEAEWDEMMAGSLRSVFLCTQGAARRIIAGGNGGSIVNVASIEALAPAALHSHYNAAKAAVVMHTRAAALELGPHRIRVNSVSPGLIWRHGIEEAWPEGVARWRQAAPLQRMGMPEDVADACLFLASAAARWITGTNLVVDGGVLAGPAF